MIYKRRELQSGFLILLIQNSLSANFLVICAKIAGMIVKIETMVTFKRNVLPAGVKERMNERVMSKCPYLFRL